MLHYTMPDPTCEHLFWPAQVRAAEEMALGLADSLFVGCYLCGVSVDLLAPARERA